MRFLCINISLLGLLLLLLAWRGWTDAQQRRAVAAETQQAITELERLTRMNDRGLQSLPAGFAARLDDGGVLARDWSIVAVIGAAVFLSGAAGIFIARRLRTCR